MRRGGGSARECLRNPGGCGSEGDHPRRGVRSRYGGCAAGSLQFSKNLRDLCGGHRRGGFCDRQPADGQDLKRSSTHGQSYRDRLRGKRNHGRLLCRRKNGCFRRCNWGARHLWDCWRTCSPPQPRAGQLSGGPARRTRHDRQLNHQSARPGSLFMKACKSGIDFRLYLVTDRILSGGRPLEQIVRESAAGGVTVVQLREKDAGAREFLEQAFTLRQAASDLAIPLIINDRVDIALACLADGVHLGQEDMHCALARRIAGKNMIIGVSVSTADEALEAEADGADYLGVGPLFATPTKADALPATGLGVLRTIRQAVRIPLVGIGGITSTNAVDVIRAGADGVA